MSAETCFSLVAEPSPYVLPRVFDVLARHGVVPAHCHTRVDARDGAPDSRAITIDLHLADVDAQLTQKLAHGLGRLVEVADILIGAKCAPR